MSTKKRSGKSDSKGVRLQVLCDKATGRIFAAGPAEVVVTGDGGPEEVKFAPLQSEVLQQVTLTPEQSLLSPRDLFGNHIVKGGRLVPAKQSD